MPSGVSGRVAERMPANRRDPVDYGQVLLRLVPIESAAFEESPTDSTPATVSGLPEGSFAVTSPTHGMFYRRPAPDASSYVEVGQVVEEGSTLGLVEVMKCFSAIVYSGPQAKVVEIRAEDTSEVQADQVLFVLEPA
jgi:acetyl-CoA carboxylase biotin carboxyl carrier protein